MATSALGKMLDRGRPHGHARVPYLRNVNVQWDRIDTTDLLTMELADEERDRFGVEAGDLLVCEGGEIGRAAIWRGGVSYIAYQKALHRIRPSGEIDSRYLLHMFRHLAMSGQLARHATGTTILHLPQQQLRRIPIPVPPIEEQRAIVAALEDHLSRLDAADAGLRTAEQRLRALREAWTDSLIWREAWSLRTVASLLAEPLRNGHSARAASDGNGIRTLTLTAVTTSTFTDANTKITSADPGKVSGLWLRPDDILVQRSNTPELVGTTAHYEGPPDWAIFPDLLIRVRVNDRDASARFVAAAMASSRAHRWLRGRAKGLAGSMPKIDQETIGNLQIPVPSLDEQRSVLAQLDTVRLSSDRLAAVLRWSGERATALKQALLQAAFSGRLTGRSSDLELAEEMITA